MIDLRLVPAALAVWGATLIGLRAGPISAVILGGVALVAAAITYLRAGSAPAARAAVVVLLLTGTACAGLAVRGHTAREHPLRHAAERGADVTARVELTARPRPLEGESYGSRPAAQRAVAQARVLSVDIGGRTSSTGGRVLLLVPTAGWEELIAGQQVLVTARAAPPDSGELLAAVLQTFERPEEVTPAPGWQRAAEDLREGLRRASSDVLSPAAAGLLPGLVVGDTRNLPPEVEQDFTDAGMTHLTAVSGANLAIVCGVVYALLHLLGAPPSLRVICSAAALLGFVVLAGPEPSVLRAAVMSAVTLLAVVLGRRRSALPALAAAVIGLLLVLPGMATTAGFALSVAATAGLVVVAPVWAHALHRRGVPPGVAEAVAVSVAAQVVTAPLVAGMFGEVSAVAVVANLLAGPLVAPATVLGVLSTVTAPLAGWFARACTWLAGPELEWVLLVADRAARVPGAVIDWPSGGLGGLLFAAGTAVALLVLRNKRNRLLVLVAVVVCVLVLVPVRTALPGWPGRDWNAIACDVGQGDGLVLATGRADEAVVVDTGPDPARQADCLRGLGVRRIPLLVLTHLHADHVSGLGAVLARYPVGAVAVGPLREPGWAMRDVARLAGERGVPVIQLEEGQRADWPRLRLDVLAPGADAAGLGSEDANDASVVLRARTPAGRILLTGDVEIPAQQGLLSSGADLRAEVLKIPHHGSRYSSPEFLRAVSPRVAIASVGADNDYGHPSPLVLGALQRAGARVLRTDQDGHIAVLPGAHGPRVAARGDPLRPDDR